jgi:hypothetical protein
MFDNNQIHKSSIHSDDFGVTGSLAASTYKIIAYPFDQYLLTIKLTPDNKFIEVLEIKINKDFLSHKQKMSSLNSIDIESYLK